FGENERHPVTKFMQLVQDNIAEPGVIDPEVAVGGGSERIRPAHGLSLNEPSARCQMQPQITVTSRRGSKKKGQCADEYNEETIDCAGFKGRIVQRNLGR